MIELNIPGRGNFKIDYIVSDVNGTIAVDGNLIPDIVRTIQRLKDRVMFHLITANTHGKQAEIDRILGVEGIIISEGAEAEQKREYIRKLDSKKVISIGQGANDAGMLSEAAIGICVLSKEGTSIEAIQNADIVVQDILTALNLIENPLRLVATLRK